MAETSRAPKQWCLTKSESITSFDNWKNNLLYTLSLDKNFAPFLKDGTTWAKQTKANPLRGLTADTDAVEEAHRRTADQKLAHLNLMLGQIANFCPILSRNSIVKNSTSLPALWQTIKTHYGFQHTGSQFLNLASIKLEPDEKPEDLFQRLTSFIEANLLLTDGGITHHGSEIEDDEELTPALENMIVFLWLQMIDKDLPSLVKQKYGTELRSRTLASIKPEISLALDSLLDEIHNINDIRVMRSFSYSQQIPPKPRPKSQNTYPRSPVCILCQTAKRQNVAHFLSKCPFLPDADKKYLSKFRSISADPDDIQVQEEITQPQPEIPSNPLSLPAENKYVSEIAQIDVQKSPYINLFFHHIPLHIVLDSGAEANLIRKAVVDRLGISCCKTNHKALQADGKTFLNVLGEIKTTLSRDGHDFVLEALVVNDLGSDILAGVPFLTSNDIAMRPARHEVSLSDGTTFPYISNCSKRNAIHKVHVLRAPSSTVLWPGEFLEMPLPKNVDIDSSVMIEPRLLFKPKATENFRDMWPYPGIHTAVGPNIRLINNTCSPQKINKNDHFGQIVPVGEAAPIDEVIPPPHIVHDNFIPVENIKLNPDNVLSTLEQNEFFNIIQKHKQVFSKSVGCYNGKYKAVVNMGPSQPPQRKGHVPQYSRNRLVELQNKFDELESQGIFQRPENVGVSVEYLNPSFLVSKPSGGSRLVTAFGEVGFYSKPQPSLLPDVNTILRQIASWRYIITTDLSNAFYQIPLSHESMKYCGVCTPFRGIRVYCRSAMGMPGSETALEEVMSRVLGDLLQEGVVAKLADDLYCGGNSISQLLHNFDRLLTALAKANLRLSAHKTVICPKETTILGWMWQQGQLRASQHRISTLATCAKPTNVKGLRSFIGAYKFLAKLLPHCANILSPLEDAAAGKDSRSAIGWNDELCAAFQKAQAHVQNCKTIALPTATDQLIIVTDGSSKLYGLGATLNVIRESKLKVAGFFSSKLRKQQKSWIPCEVEALAIAAALRHFAPFIIQSQHQVCVFTDSKPCVQATKRLYRGEFSTSPRIYSFLAAVSHFQADIQHIAGNNNILADFESRNSDPCESSSCQICKYISDIEESPVIRQVNLRDIMEGCAKLPYTNRKAWKDIQMNCKSLRRTCAHLRQGTRPSKKSTNIRDVKRYLQSVTIASDGLLVVREQKPLRPPYERIVVPRGILDGIITALHLKLDHPSRHQLRQVLSRQLFGLDMDSAIAKASDACHQCQSLMKIPNSVLPQSTTPTPAGIGYNFAADIMKRERQLILVIRETTTAFTVATIIENETSKVVGPKLVELLSNMIDIGGFTTCIRTDPAPCFVSLQNSPLLKKYKIHIEIGRVKNVNKNPIAEKAIQEIIQEALKQQPQRGTLSPLLLSLVCSRLNSRIRNYGLSARECWTGRDQFTNHRLLINDNHPILKRQHDRTLNHASSEKSKTPSGKHNKICPLAVGDIVYLYVDGNKCQARDRYIVQSIDGQYCSVMKLSGSIIRKKPYKVRLDECYKVTSQLPTLPLQHQEKYTELTSSGDEYSILPEEEPATSAQPRSPPLRRSSRQRSLPRRFEDYVIYRSTEPSSDEEM